MADSVLQDIKDRLDVVEVVSSYIPVKRSGTNYKATCPFHNEKSASLMISPQKQIWHCFGCGEGGDIYGFVTRFENVEFKQALKLLADKAGVQLPQYSPQQKAVEDEHERLARINNFAAKFYHQYLEKSSQAQHAREYLTKRGLTEKTIIDWTIGFAPDEFHALEKALVAKQVTIADLVKAGVSVKNDKGQVYDRFRARVTFPIHNYYGDVVGFSARTLETNTDTAKYINSPETAIYNKSQVLFGLYFAKQSIRKLDTVVVVEGQMDCIQAHQAGFANTIATSGTALTTDHVRQIGRLTKNIFFCFDADSAGSKATRRAGELALAHGMQVKVVPLSGGKDPDEIIRQDPKLWEQALASALWFIDFYIAKAVKEFTPGSVEQKQYFKTEILPLLSALEDPIERDHYLHSVAASFGITEAVLRDLVSKTRGQTQAAVAPVLAIPGKEQDNGLEKSILGGVLSYPDFQELVRTTAQLDDFPDGLIKDLLRPLWEGGQITPDHTLAKEAQFMVESQLEALNNNQEALLRELRKSFYIFKLQAIKRVQEHITRQLQRAESSGDGQAIKQLQQQFAQVMLERTRFEKEL